MKIDYKKDFKDIYMPKEQPTIVEIPIMNFISLEGEGDPNREEFGEETAALYGLTYAVKMSYKGKEIPENYYEYTVFPLEGVWDIKDKTKSSLEKSNLKYNIMIRQPDFLTNELFERFKSEVMKKKPNRFIENVKFETIYEGRCCQMLHRGSYDDEPASFEQMKRFCEANGYRRISLVHREIYLSDPRKTATEKMRTILRFQVEKI